MPILHKWEDDGQHCLLIRRPLDDPEKKTYYLVFAPVGTTLAELVKVIGQRWHIEEDIQIGKEMGLADYEVRGFTAWYRYITLVMLVQAHLARVASTCSARTACATSAGSGSNACISSPSH
ncbi:MAG: hypothetical protein E6J34_00020 [Chloroflexi bacterium]|nr:MAG: hypothetical protein E6J34_00020 [Chloroflexota bacterium]